MSNISHLFHLQGIDDQIDLLARQIAEIDSKINSTAEMDKMEKEHKEITENLFRANQALSALESESSAVRIKIQQSESSLYGGKVSSPKELVGLQTEISMLKNKITQLEDPILECMGRVEDLEAELKDNEQNRKDLEVNLQVQRSVWTVEKGNLQNSKLAVEKERSAQTQQIPQNTLKQYELLRTQKRGKAVVLCQEGNCSACGAEVTPRDQQAARSGESIIYCPTCGRILYIE
jgi:predicted  nucleic acid-binding Zn-ribbon protein